MSLTLLPAARVAVIASDRALGTRPSSSIATWMTSHSYARKTPRAPTYDGASTSTTSPGSQKMRTTRSRAIWEPVVTTMSSGWAETPDLADHLEDLLAEGDVTLARAVLEGLRAALVEQPLRRVGEHVDGQGLHVGHPAGQRHDLGPRGDGEQGPDLRRAHGVGATGIRVHPWIEPGTSGHANHLASASRPLTWLSASTGSAGPPRVRPTEGRGSCGVRSPSSGSSDSAC